MRTPVKKISCILFCLPVLLSFLMGCGMDTDPLEVDFSKTVSIEGPPHNSREESQTIKLAVGAMVSPRDSFVHYGEMLAFIGRKTGKTTEFIQRKTYGEINELLGSGGIDIAIICSGPFFTGREAYGFEPLAVPVAGGQYFYKSYLIVKDDDIRDLEDLRGRTFAFTDPESNTGRLVPTYWLAQMGEAPESFFGKLIYTYSHDNSILAVSRGLVDGAAVDSLVWDHYRMNDPAFASSIRVVRRSEPYPAPPIVASAHLSEQHRKQVAAALLAMHDHPEGRRILDQLGIDRFVTPPDDWFEGFDRIENMLSSIQGKAHGSQEP